MKYLSVEFVNSCVGETGNKSLSEISERTHFLFYSEAELYSSTLLSLTKIDTFRHEYYAVFDEVSGDKVRAYSN